jgi:RNA polymerase sigma-70 factor, ECF subfamily
MTMARATPDSLEHELVEPHERRDEDAFIQAAEALRGELLAHCYRMLGSVHDAEDALQEALVRGWRGFPSFAGRSSLRTWLYRIATNACLDVLARRPKRVLPVDHGPAASSDDPGEPLVETVWVEPFPDEVLALPDGYAAPDARYEQREAVELAFIAALQHLTAMQRAVLVLREVLGFSAREVAETLETSVPSVNSALQRARKSLGRRLPERSQQATLRALGDARVREVVEAYVEAWRLGDVHALRTLLAEDVAFSMPPWTSWWRGRERVAGFAKEAVEVCARSHTVHTRANGQPAIAYYQLNAEAGRFDAAALDVLTFEGSQIKEITAFVTPEIFGRFGLPAELPA